MPDALADLNRAWNAQERLTSFNDVMSHLPALTLWAQQRQRPLLALDDLSTNLVRFIESQLASSAKMNA
jgi:hypothetical protein